MGRGGRRSARRTTGFSSMQTTGSASESGFSYKASTSSLRAMYSPSSSPTHHIFFPPRLHIMIPEQNADRLPTHLRHQRSLHRFLGDEANAPTRPAGRRLATHHSDDPLALARVQPPRLARTRLLVQRRLQALFLVTPGNRPHGLGSHAQMTRHLGRRLSLIELTQDQCSPQYRADSRPLFSISTICFRSRLPI